MLSHSITSKSFKLSGSCTLYTLTSRSEVYFLAGPLPFSAYLHIRQLRLFAMPAREFTCILSSIASYKLSTSADSSKSWFVKIRYLCHMYFLRHPLTLLQDQPDKEMFKSQVKLSVQEYWQKTLRGEAESLHSLTYFKPNFMSLSKPHPLWITCGSSPMR